MTENTDEKKYRLWAGKPGKGIDLARADELSEQSFLAGMKAGREESRKDRKDIPNIKIVCEIAEKAKKAEREEWDRKVGELRSCIQKQCDKAGTIEFDRGSKEEIYYLAMVTAFLNCLSEFDRIFKQPAQENKPEKKGGN
jgi:hypothetical protein